MRSLHFFEKFSWLLDELLLPLFFFFREGDTGVSKFSECWKLFVWLSPA